MCTDSKEAAHSKHPRREAGLGQPRAHSLGDVLQTTVCVTSVCPADKRKIFSSKQQAPRC